MIHQAHGLKETETVRIYKQIWPPPNSQQRRCTSKEDAGKADVRKVSFSNSMCIHYNCNGMHGFGSSLLFQT
jgi:hypothetical protein